MRILLSTIGCLVCVCVFTQDVDYLNTVEQRIIKNIFLYRAKLDEIKYIKNGYFLSDENNKDFVNIIPNTDKRLKIKMKASNYSYPLEGYNVLEIYKGNDSYSYNGGTISTLEMKYSFDDYFLIAVNPKKDIIKYISGNFFLSKLESDFQINEGDIESLIQYLNMKLFKYQLRNIILKEQNSDSYIFTAESIDYSIAVNISVSKDDYDNIVVNKQ